MDNVDNSENIYKERDITIYQHNNFLAAKKDYSIVAQRICRMAIADIRPRLSGETSFYTKEFSHFFISINDLQKILKETNRDKFKQKIEMVKKELWKPIRVGTHEKNVEFVVFDRIDWDDKTGITLKFSETMREFLIELETGNYTKMQLKAAFQLSSSYALVLLDLMLQYQGKSKNGIIERTLTVEELRFSLNVPENAYTNRMNNFRRFVLDYPIKEINEKTDFHIFPNYELMHGKYNKVTGFKFRMALPQLKQVKDAKEQNPTAGDDVDERDPRDLVERLKCFGVHGRVANRLAKMEHAEESFGIAMKYIRSGTVANKAAYIRKAIEENFYGQQAETERAKREEWKREVERNKQNIAAATGLAPDYSKPPLSFEPPIGEASEERLLRIIEENNDNPIGKTAQKALRQVRAGKGKKKT